MIDTVQQLKTRFESLADTHFLSSELDSVASDLNDNEMHHQSYYVKEAQVNLNALFEVCDQLFRHLHDSEPPLS